MINIPIGSLPSTTITPTTVTTAAGTPTTVPATSVPSTVAPPGATSTTATAATSTVPPPASTATTATTAPPAGTTPYSIPVADQAAAGWGQTHAGYPASDIFVKCGAVIVSPVNGTILEVRRENLWVAAIDNPATRGGRSIAILGDDGVRYYLAHFESIEGALRPGARLEVGQRLGLMGMTGRASACHVHFAISPPCPGKEWSVRRGVIWPWRYLDSWRDGGQLSPAAEVQQWVARSSRRVRGGDGRPERAGRLTRTLASMATDLLPAAFIGHGSPMNALDRNRYTEAWRAFGGLGAPGRAPSWSCRPTGTSTPRP